ncbi:MAG: hypothetical protein QE487_05300 [Fluviicola sp.]|nr:hypothetical protein [Fluviicola sp.]
MKKVLFVGIFFCAFNLFGQKTIQFADPLPPNYTLVDAVNKSQFGSYKSTNSETVYLFDESGVYIVSTLVAYITREQLRESATIQVRNGHLFGINKNDSIPCVLEGERYYYGIQHKQVIIGSGSLHQLSKIDNNNYLINFHVDNYFEPSMLTFEKGGMKIVHAELSYQPTFSNLLKITSVEQYGSMVDIVTPTAEQWPSLREQLFTGEALNYLKETE